MGRRQRLKARHAIGAVVTRAGIDSVELLDGQPGRAERTRAARERNAGHQVDCACGTAPRSDNWFKVRNFVDQPNRAAIYLFEEIGYWGTSALEFVQILNQLNVDFLDVHINSPGGEVDDGIAIFNALRQHKAYVTVYIDSLAASAASFIAMAGDKVCISEFGQVMIHDAMGIEFGNAAEMRTFADLLDRYSDNIAGIYAGKSGGDAGHYRDLMRAETWFTGTEAVTAGLCDEVHDLMAAADEPDEAEDEPMAARMTARWDLSLFSFRYQGREQAPAPVLTNQTEPVEPAAEPSADEEASVDATDLTNEAEPVEPAGSPELDPESSSVPATPGSAVTETARNEGEEAADSAVDVPNPEPAAAPADDTTPNTETAEVDVFAQAANALLSAIPAPPSPDDAFAALKEGLLS